MYSLANESSRQWREATLESGRVGYHIADVPVGEMLDDFTLLIAPQVQAKGVGSAFTLTLPRGLTPM